MDIARHRLHNQRIAGAAFTTPGEVVAWLGAVQAQDYLGALWAVGLRMQSAAEADVEQALAGRTILRTWPMRGTLHFVAAADAQWMLELLTPKVLASQAPRLRKEFGLDQAVFARSREALVPALQGGRRLTRKGMYQTLEAAGIATADQRGLHILWWLAQEGLICFGAREGKQQTFVLLDEWAPGGKRLEREEALTELARRYFTSHGPATAQDFAWWSGLAPADAAVGLEMAGPVLAREVVDGKTYWFSAAMASPASASPAAHLLPAYDEYTVAYKDRGAVLAPPYAKRADAGSGIFHPTMILDGQVVGTWKRELSQGSVEIALRPFAPLRKAGTNAFAGAARRYGAFLGLPVGTTF